MTFLIAIWTAIKASKPLQYAIGVALGLICLVAIAWFANSWYVEWRKDVTREQTGADQAAVIEADSRVLAADREVERIQRDADATVAERREAEEKAKAARVEHLKAIEKSSGEQSKDFQINWNKFCELYPEDPQYCK